MEDSFDNSGTLRKEDVAMIGGNNAVRVEENPHNGGILEEKKGYKVIDCLECGYAHILPVPDDAELKRIYRDEYFSMEKPDFIESLSKDRAWWNVLFDERLEFMESRLAQGSRRLLDVGCGQGFFLKRGAERGWRCLGVEPSKKAASYAGKLGLNVINNFFDSQTMKEEGCHFNAAHISEVLEYVVDPLSILEGAYDLLDDGGIVCVVAPNDFSPVQKVLSERLGYKPYWLGPPNHINYFSLDSLKKLLKKAGFSIVRVTATFPMDFFLLMGKNYVDNESLGKERHAMKRRLDIMLGDPRPKALKERMYDLMASHNIGRETLIYGVKE